MLCWGAFVVMLCGGAPVDRVGECGNREGPPVQVHFRTGRPLPPLIADEDAALLPINECKPLNAKSGMAHPPGREKIGGTEWNKELHSILSSAS